MILQYCIPPSHPLYRNLPLSIVERELESERRRRSVLHLSLKSSRVQPRTIEMTFAKNKNTNALIISSRKLLLFTTIITIVLLETRAFSTEIFQQVITQLGTGTFTPEVLTQLTAQIQAEDVAASGLGSILGAITATVGRNNKKRSNNSYRGIMSIGEGVSTLLGLASNPPSIYDYETPTEVEGKLDLTPEEQSLLELLQRVRDQYSPRTTIRIAGGWVRDKLIYGKATPSRDIDLVLSDTSGKEFAEKICRYFDEKGEDHAEIHIVQQSSSSKGEQAEHLQTASLVISGFDVDFCRLRYEKYDKDSRMPTYIGVGTAVEDAWRRDLTINALYYNINTNQVEDFTERGIKDLLSQTIATPKKPLPTLLEDPMRILRAIRFAAQLSFDVSPQLIRAARDDRVRYALQYKVSREAIGAAIDEIFRARVRDPKRGIQLLMTTNLIDVVFPLEAQQQDGDEPLSIYAIQQNQVKSMAIYSIGLEILTRTQSLVTRIFIQKPELEWDISKRRLLWYAAFFKPVYGMMSSRNASRRGKRQESVFYQLLDALKRPKTDMQLIESILKGVDPLRKMIAEGIDVDIVQAALGSSEGRHLKWEELSDLRWKLYKTLKPIGTMWKESLLLALASFPNSIDNVNTYHELVCLVEDKLHLKEILDDKNKPRPLLNGTQIQEFIPGVGGRAFRHIIESMEEWQVKNICDDVDHISDFERSQLEGELIEYLGTAFAEYEESMRITATK